MKALCLWLVLLLLSTPSLAQRRGNRNRDSHGRFAKTNTLTSSGRFTKSNTLPSIGGRHRTGTSGRNKRAPGAPVQGGAASINTPAPQAPLPSPDDPLPELIFAQVLAVESGDTLLIRDVRTLLEYRMHLDGIEAPSKGKPLYQESRDCLQRLLEQSPALPYTSPQLSQIVVTPTKWVRTTAFHGELSVVNLLPILNLIQTTNKTYLQLEALNDAIRDGKNAAWKQLQAGMAKWDRVAQPDDASLQFSEKYAKEQRLGIWKQ